MHPWLPLAYYPGMESSLEDKRILEAYHSKRERDRGRLGKREEILRIEETSLVGDDCVRKVKQTTAGVNAAS